MEVIMKTNRYWIFSFTLLFSITLSACGSLPFGGDDSIQASGVVEIIEIIISPEIGGRIAQVWVGEGDRVAQSDPLFRIENRLLEAQLRQAESAQAIAKANYDLVAAGLTEEERQASIAIAQLELTSAQYNLDQLYENHNLVAAETLQAKKNAEEALEDLLNPDLQQALAAKAIADAKKGVKDADKRLYIVKSVGNQKDIDAAWAQVVLTEKALEDAQKEFNKWADKPESNLTRATHQAKLSEAQYHYDAAVRRHNGISSTGSEIDINVAEAELATSEAQLLEAERDWEDLKDGPKPEDVAYYEALIAYHQGKLDDLDHGPDPDDVALTEERVANAQAQLDLAKSQSPTPEQLAVSQAQFETARANLEAAQVQLDLLKVTSPVDGVVMTRSIEPGEIIPPGVAALSIGQLDNLTVTVFIPENKYGQINLGDLAQLSSDSFPGQTFDATVVRIADRAEYTPRNVQTQEERVTTVYAIKLIVSNPRSHLKPGMPVDVIFR
jgi:multidrug resistance efflux pump